MRTIESLVRRFEDGQLTRRELVLSLFALLLLQSEAEAQPSATHVPVSALNHIGLTVTNLERSLDFYQRVLGLSSVTARGGEANPTPRLRIGSGPQFISFSQGDTPSVNHYCFGMEGFEAGRVVDRLATLGVEARVQENRGMDPSPEDLTCHDPDGLLVALSS